MRLLASYLVWTSVVFLFLCLSCSRRDNKYQEYVDEKIQKIESKTPETKDTLSEKQTTKFKKPGLTISPLEANENIGKFASVKGYVAEVNRRERVAYLNFVEIYPKTPFTGVIFANKFEEFGDLNKYLNKEVELTGIISIYKGKPQIVLDDKSQIRIVK